MADFIGSVLCSRSELNRRCLWHYFIRKVSSAAEICDKEGRQETEENKNCHAEMSRHDDRLEILCDGQSSEDNLYGRRARAAVADHLTIGVFRCVTHAPKVVATIRTPAVIASPR